MSDCAQPVRRCPPACDPHCTAKHSELLVELLNIKPNPDTAYQKYQLRGLMKKFEEVIVD